MLQISASLIYYSLRIFFRIVPSHFLIECFIVVFYVQGRKKFLYSWNIIWIRTKYYMFTYRSCNYVYIFQFCLKQ